MINPKLVMNSAHRPFSADKTINLYPWRPLLLLVVLISLLAVTKKGYGFSSVISEKIETDRSDTFEIEKTSTFETGQITFAGFTGFTAEQNLAAGADTLHLTLEEAEVIFLNQNLMLVAQHLNLDMREAAIRQARLWENPEITVEHQIINREGESPVGFTDTDNTVFEIEQLISTAGKRGRTVQLRESEKLEAEHQFDLLLREMKRTLRENFFELAFLNREAELYHQQIESLGRVLVSFEDLQRQGDIARIETLRLRSLLIELEEDYSQVLSDQVDMTNTLKLMLHMQMEVPLPMLPEDIEVAVIPVDALDKENLLEIAQEYRSDLRSLDTASDVARQMLRVERAHAFPDVGVGLEYDRFDGPVENYWGLSLNFQIPLFNRNQGAIQAAQYQIRQTDHLHSQLQLEIMHDIDRALQRYERALRLFARIEHDDEEDFSDLIQILLRQYQEGEIRLVEFIDYYDSFREGMFRIWNIHEEILRSAEDLNFTTGQDVIELNF